MLEDDIATNKTMAGHGARHVLRHHGNQPVTMLTHCNTGALATAGYGTALGKVKQASHCAEVDSRWTHEYGNLVNQGVIVMQASHCPKVRKLL